MKKHLNTSFLLGFIAGILLTSLVFTGYNYVESSNTEQVTVTVLTCGNCSYERFRTVTDGIFDAEYREIAYNTEKGQEIIKKYDIRHVPGFIYSKNVEEARNFSHAEAQLVEFEDAYVLSDTGSEVAQRFSEGFELE